MEKTVKDNFWLRTTLPLRCLKRTQFLRRGTPTRVSRNSSCRMFFSRTWQAVGRTEQVAKPGQYVTASVAGEPVVVVRGSDNLKFASVFQRLPGTHAMNRCMNEPCGQTPHLRCPYHGWTYNLEGEVTR